MTTTHITGAKPSELDSICDDFFFGTCPRPVRGPVRSSCETRKSRGGRKSIDKNSENYFASGWHVEKSVAVPFLKGMRRKNGRCLQTHKKVSAPELWTKGFTNGWHLPMR